LTSGAVPMTMCGHASKQETPCDCGNSRMGAGHPGGSRPNGVITVPILPDPLQPGRGPIMSSIVALAAPAAPSPVILKFPDPDEVRRRRGHAIAAACRIEERKPGLWVVPAQTGGGS
jgi:hypothetical protein